MSSNITSDPLCCSVTSTDKVGLLAPHKFVARFIAGIKYVKDIDPITGKEVVRETKSFVRMASIPHSLNVQSEDFTPHSSTSLNDHPNVSQFMDLGEKIYRANFHFHSESSSPEPFCPTRTPQLVYTSFDPMFGWGVGTIADYTAYFNKQS